MIDEDVYLILLFEFCLEKCCVKGGVNFECVVEVICVVKECLEF